MSSYEDISNALSRARVAADDALSAAIQLDKEREALHQENLDLKAQLAALRPPEPRLLYDLAYTSVIPGEPTVHTEGRREDLTIIPGEGTIFRLTNYLRLEQGIKNPSAKAVLSEPLDSTRQYHISFRLENWTRFSHKVIPFQFWQVPGESPVACLEVTADFLRLVRNVNGREVLYESGRPNSGVWQYFRVDAQWGTNGFLRVFRAHDEGAIPTLIAEKKERSIYLTTNLAYMAPRFKWGLYCPAIGDEVASADLRAQFKRVQIYGP